MIKLIDRDGHKVKMTKEAIAESLRVMGNPQGMYYLLPKDWTGNVTEHSVLRFKASRMPKYSWFQKWQKERWWKKGQKRKERWFKANNPLNLIWEEVPFVLETPWLQLRGKKAISIYVCAEPINIKNLGVFTYEEDSEQDVVRAAEKDCDHDFVERLLFTEIVGVNTKSPSDPREGRVLKCRLCGETKEEYIT